MVEGTGWCGGGWVEEMRLQGTFFFFSENSAPNYHVFSV